LDADATVNTGGKVNPVPVSTLDIFARTFVDTSNRAGINAISDAFAGISNNSMGHCSLKDLGITSGLSLLFLAYQDSAVTSSPTGVVMHQLVGMGEMRRMREMREIGEIEEKLLPYLLRLPHLPYLPHLPRASPPSSPSPPSLKAKRPTTYNHTPPPPKQDY
jgi:hypothetical protein